ncbi:arylsulfatase b [Nesidiocoris tenuis]|uniref:Arylsulfatase b n=1 Tax=Nesidiocoris tenuis TaxID=355587 RepID=A0ABN7AT98_9HEMI|nr:arylsulfatase b [Nesidiocoris tenuis]
MFTIRLVESLNVLAISVLVLSKPELPQSRIVQVPMVEGEYNPADYNIDVKTATQSGVMLGEESFSTIATDQNCDECSKFESTQASDGITSAETNLLEGEPIGVAEERRAPTRKHRDPPNPHIVFILADDLGWNDVGFHGSNQIPTPNIDALAYSGVILQNYYVQPVCTPSRSALMTGKYPMRIGMQHSVLFGAEPRGLPLSEKLLPEYLRDMGYTTRMAGKWHLGSWKKEYLPTNRGFESHIGSWTGHQDHNDHTAMETGMWGLDMRIGMDVAYGLHGQSTTDVVTAEAVRVIKSHPQDVPLFLYVAHSAVHSGNPYNPLCTKDADAEKFTNITDYNRRRFAGLLHRLDWSVGEVVAALEKRGMLENSIIVFSTDNGGPAEGFNLNAASNWPLRGVKNTPWEGGVRGAAFIWSHSIRNKSRTHHDLFHIVDWLPTLLKAANTSNELIEGIDGLDMWNSLTEGAPGERDEILLNIDDRSNVSSLRVAQYKLIKGTTYKGQWDDWYGPSGRNGQDYDVKAVLSSKVSHALAAIGQELSPETVVNLRIEAEVKCQVPQNATECHPLSDSCLFDIEADPCEYNNLAQQHPQVLKRMEKRLNDYKKAAMPAGNLPVDPRGDPKHWGYIWTNWGDYVKDS